MSYFKRGKDYLKSPIKKIVFTKNRPNESLFAGLTALSEVSMFNASNHLIVAIDYKKLPSIQTSIIQNKDMIKDEKLIEIQVWNYDPHLFSNKSNVNIVSLYASLKGEKDEIIEQTLEEALRGEHWYMD